VLFLVNEYFYFACVVYTFAFTNYTPDPDSRFQIGWFYLSFLSIILLVNVVVMVFDTVQGLILYCKRRKFNRRVQAMRKLQLERSAKIKASCETDSIS